MVLSCSPGPAFAASVHTAIVSISDVWRAWRRSAERVSRVSSPALVITRHWKKQ